jgi:hypothetical protein
MQFIFPQMAQCVPRKTRTAARRRPVDHGLRNRRQVHDQGKPRHNKDEMRILEFLGRVGDTGATRHEISVALEMAYTTVSGRVADLKRKSEVKDTAEKRPTPTGSPACVVVRIGKV